MERIIETDSKGRVSLGTEYANQRFIMDKENGDVTLRKAVVIPERELWLYQNPEAWGKVQMGLQQAKEGKLHLNPVDLDQFDEN